MITLFPGATYGLFQSTAEHNKQLNYFRMASEETKHYHAEIT